MNRTGTAATHRTRTAALAATTVAAVTALAWVAVSSGPDGTASAAVTTSAVALADADAIGLVGTDPLPPLRRLPRELRADLRELRATEPDQRREAAARIWQDALAGEYGARVQLRAETARHRFGALPEELQDDIEELRGLTGDERSEERTAIRDKALAGAYGDEVRRWAERRSDFWRQD
ncbi:hypothetical protein AB0I00_34145 [Streptomyces sp. NPDC050803]|uniref:hypothetical protein n=1 Tax=unclassified Streptomyces TaxID=2593676 RepID=UPI0034188FC9